MSLTAAWTHNGQTHTLYWFSILIPVLSDRTTYCLCICNSALILLFCLTTSKRWKPIARITTARRRKMSVHLTRGGRSNSSRISQPTSTISQRGGCKKQILKYKFYSYMSSWLGNVILRIFRCRTWMYILLLASWFQRVTLLQHHR